MVATIRDWQRAGITLKVEVATSGSLVVGSNQTDFPLNTGGAYGGPVGWQVGQYQYGQPPFNQDAYNWTTSQQVFSVSVKAVPATALTAGGWSPTFPVTPGYRYQAGAQARQMAGKAASQRSVAMEVSNNGGTSFTYYTGSASVTALPDYEDILATGNPVQAGYTLARLTLFGSPPSNNLGLWGVQFQNVYTRQMDLAPPALTWRDITCDVRSIGIRYGRERFTNRYDVAGLTIELINDAGLYSYHNPHPFGLQPGRQVRVTATHDGKTYPMAFHVVDTLTDGYSTDGHVISRWQCVDPTTVLSNATVATTQAPGIKSGERIGMLLDQVGYMPRKLDIGQWSVQPIKASGRSIRDECGVTADTEGGNFYADREGNCAYKDRTWPTTDADLQTVTADLVGYPAVGGMPVVDTIPTQADAPLICTNELVTDWSLARVINDVILANAGGTVQEFKDLESMKTYGPQTYTRLDFVGANLAVRADDIMGGYSDPVLRVNSVGFAPGISNAWEWTLSVFLNWLVRVWYTHPTNYWGYAACLHIQSIEHRITPDDWTMALTVDLPESFVELEWANGYGWDDGVWDENLWDQSAMGVGAQWSSGFKWSDPTSKWGK